MAYHRSRGVETDFVRIFKTYGPRLQPNDGRVISNFIAQPLRGGPLTVAERVICWSLPCAALLGMTSPQLFALSTIRS